MANQNLHRDIALAAIVVLRDVGRADILERTLAYARSEARYLESMKVELDVDQVLRDQQVLLAGCWSVLAAMYDDLGMPGPVLASAALYEFHIDASSPLEDLMVAAAEFFLESETDADAARIRVRVREMRVLPRFAHGAGRKGFVS